MPVAGVDHALLDGVTFQQIELTARAERMLFAGATKNFKATYADGPRRGKPLSGPFDTAPGTRLVVEWVDPRPDDEVWAPAGVGRGRSEFTYWDGPSLCYEMHASATGIHDHEKRHVRGLWLYLALEVKHHYFWSMMLNYHSIGYVFPLLSPSSNAPSIFSIESERVLREALTTHGIRSEMMCVLSYAAKRLNAPGARPFPDPCEVASRLQLPRWAILQEEHWGRSLHRYIAGIAPAPCLWVCKVGQGLVGCKAATKCVADHEGPVATMRAI